MLRRSLLVSFLRQLVADTAHRTAAVHDAPQAIPAQQASTASRFEKPPEPEPPSAPRLQSALFQSALRPIPKKPAAQISDVLPDDAIRSETKITAVAVAAALRPDRNVAPKQDL